MITKDLKVKPIKHVNYLRLVFKRRYLHIALYTISNANFQQGSLWNYDFLLVLALNSSSGNALQAKKKEEKRRRGFWTVFGGKRRENEISLGIIYPPMCFPPITFTSWLWVSRHKKPLGRVICMCQLTMRVLWGIVNGCNNNNSDI